MKAREALNVMSKSGECFIKKERERERERERGRERVHELERKKKEGQKC